LTLLGGIKEMAKINYTFADGHTEEIEVNGKFYTPNN
jgi:prepilin-type processing-associated H-X9-DG protein